VPTDWINVFGGRTPDEPIGVMATLDQEPASMPSRLPFAPDRDFGHEPPGA
jgi:hypothetical protein